MGVDHDRYTDRPGYSNGGNGRPMRVLTIEQHSRKGNLTLIHSIKIVVKRRREYQHTQPNGG